MNTKAKAITILSGLFLIATTAFADVPAHNVEVTTASASIQLSGSVARRVNITVEGMGLWNNLDLTIDVNEEAVAKVTEFSNVRQGYTVTLASSNGGKLIGSGDGEELPYSLSYNGVAVSFANPITSSAVKTDRLGLEKTLSISYAAAEANLVSDFYSDNLTFTITAN